MSGFVLVCCVVLVLIVLYLVFGRHAPAPFVFR